MERGAKICITDWAPSLPDTPVRYGLPLEGCMCLQMSASLLPP